LRDEGTISNITFRDIQLVSQYYSDPWWGRGEAISFTAIPRTPATRLGRLRDITVENVTGQAENSVRVNGSPQSVITDVRFKNVYVEFSRWTKYPGGVYDNRPTQVLEPFEKHAADGFNLRFVQHFSLVNCTAHWNDQENGGFAHAIAAAHAHDVTVSDFTGDSSRHPIILR
jgi:hypothetical protein